jgi:hypothetical protein
LRSLLYGVRADLRDEISFLELEKAQLRTAK